MFFILFLLQVIDVNLKGTFLMTQVHSLNLIKQLTASGESDRNISGLNGSIVNIASASAKVCISVSGGGVLNTGP